MQVLGLFILEEILIKILGFKTRDSFLDFCIGANCYILCFLQLQPCKEELVGTALRQSVAILNCVLVYFRHTTQMG